MGVGLSVEFWILSFGFWVVFADVSDPEFVADAPE
jgi:hypothetical protein